MEISDPEQSSNRESDNNSFIQQDAFITELFEDIFQSDYLQNSFEDPSSLPFDCVDDYINKSQDELDLLGLIDPVTDYDSCLSINKQSSPVSDVLMSQASVAIKDENIVKDQLASNDKYMNQISKAESVESFPSQSLLSDETQASTKELKEEKRNLGEEKQASSSQEIRRSKRIIKDTKKTKQGNRNNNKENIRKNGGERWIVNDSKSSDRRFSRRLRGQKRKLDFQADDLDRLVPRRRNKRCRKCAACNAEDCGDCVNCRDKPKFGGPNKKKAACLMRKCSLLTSASALVSNNDTTELSFNDIPVEILGHVLREVEDDIPLVSINVEDDSGFMSWCDNSALNDEITKHDHSYSKSCVEDMKDLTEDDLFCDEELVSEEQLEKICVSIQESKTMNS